MHPALYAPLIVVVWCHFYLNLQDLSFMGKYKGNNIKNQFFCPSAFTVFQRCKICLQVPAFHQKENWRDNNLRPSNLYPILHPYTLLKSNKKNFSERMRILLFFLGSYLSCFCFSRFSTQMRLKKKKKSNVWIYILKLTEKILVRYIEIVHNWYHCPVYYGWYKIYHYIFYQYIFLPILNILVNCIVCREGDRGNCKVFLLV